jgi:hypothetical protein
MKDRDCKTYIFVGIKTVRCAFFGEKNRIALLRRVVKRFFTRKRVTVSVWHTFCIWGYIRQYSGTPERRNGT